MTFAKRGLALTACAVMGLATALVVAAPASASGSSISLDEEANLRVALQDADLSPVVQDQLIQKTRDGISWDSVDGSAPVSTETEVKDGYEVTTSYFADGSVTETGVEVGREATPAELVTMVANAAPFLEEDYSGDYVVDRMSARASGIDSCTFGYAAGVRYATGCHIFYHGITASNSFKADYQQWSGGSSTQYINGTAQFVSAVQTVSNEQVNSIDGGTGIRYSFNTALAGWGSIPGFLQLKVSSGGTLVTYG